MNKNTCNNKSEIQENYDGIWYKFFNIRLKVFKKEKFFFHNMIETDGVGVSIIFKG